jgi:Putative polyhydroxyalkanoic acid system protein (PHA_gran_rgn)
LSSNAARTSKSDIATSKWQQGVNNVSKAITVTVSHNLGAEAARRRIETGIAQFRSSFGSKLSACEENWIGNHLDFKVGFMGQICQGELDVFDSQVRLEIVLPGLLGFLADKVQSVARKKGQLLLGRQ